MLNIFIWYKGNTLNITQEISTFYIPQKVPPHSPNVGLPNSPFPSKGKNIQKALVEVCS